MDQCFFFVKRTHLLLRIERSTFFFILLRSIHANQSDFPDTFLPLHSRHESPRNLFTKIFLSRFPPRKKSIYFVKVSLTTIQLHDDNITNIEVLLKFIIYSFLLLLYIVKISLTKMNKLFLKKNYIIYYIYI